MAAMISAEIDFDHEEWSRPENTVQPSEDPAELYEEGFAGYLKRVEAARKLWRASARWWG